MGHFDRIAAMSVTRIARRWPADVSDDLARAWLGELAALRSSPLRVVTFVGGLALAAPVEPPGEPVVTWRDRAGVPLATAAAVVLMTAGLFNLTHGLVSGAPHLILLVAALGLVGWVGFRSRYRFLTTPLIGTLMFAFLFAGNGVAVMPFMGWRDIGPAVLTWTAGTAVALAVARTATTRLARGLVGAIGSAVALDATAIAGSVHAAGALHVRSADAYFWLPLALGGHGGVLIGNLAAIAGPLTLCSAYLLAQTVGEPAAPSHRSPWIAFVPGAAVVAWSVVEANRHLHDNAATALAGIARNSYVFGFGFATTLPGILALALAGALCGAHLRRDCTPAT
jgi:hypothetical protein